MGLDARIYRVGKNYVTNMDWQDPNYTERYMDILESNNPQYESHFRDFKELDEKVRELCGGKEGDYEFELKHDIVEELMSFAINSVNEQSNILALSCKDAFRALREGYKIIYASDR